MVMTRFIDGDRRFILNSFGIIRRCLPDPQGIISSATSTKTSAADLDIPRAVQDAGRISVDTAPYRFIMILIR